MSVKYRKHNVIVDPTGENLWDIDTSGRGPVVLYGSSGNPIAIGDDGSIDVNIQDQTTVPIDALFAQSVSAFTISQDATASTVDAMSYTFELTAGHGVNVGDELILLDTASDRALQCVAITVATNTLTIDRPIDHAFASATTLGRIVTTEMAVNGSLASPQIFTFRAALVPTDIVRFIITITDDTSMDDSRFGGIAALTNGLILRIDNSFQKTIFNFKSNQDIKQFCYDVEYSDKAPAGEFGLSARITFGGQSKHGVVLRVSDDDVIQWIVQDDLTELTTLKIACQGHETSGE
jgi:hypothetical protein